MTSYLFYGVAVIIGRSASICHVHCLVSQQLVDNTPHAFTSMTEDKISKFGRREGGSKVLPGKSFWVDFGWITPTHPRDTRYTRKKGVQFF